MAEECTLRTRDELGQYLNARGLVGVAVEVGVFAGKFSRTLLRTWRGRRLYLVDPWSHQRDYLDSWNAADSVHERRFLLARRRLAEFGDRVVFMRMRSEGAVVNFSDGALDLVYLDANHAYQYVISDLTAWFPKVREGGLVAGHDYFDAGADRNFNPIHGVSLPTRSLTSYGVRSAVDEFVRATRLTLNVTREKWPTWWFVKGDR